MNAIKRYWSWQTRPLVAFVSGGVLTAVTDKLDLLTLALSFW